MKFNFNKPMLDLAGDQIKDQDGSEMTIGKLLSTELVNQSKGDAVKFHAWAVDMYNCKDLNLDKSDVRTLTEFIEGSEKLTVLAKAQMLNLLFSPSE